MCLRLYITDDATPPTGIAGTAAVAVARLYAVDGTTRSSVCR